jgi:hypothetical protein
MLHRGFLLVLVTGSGALAGAIFQLFDRTFNTAVGADLVTAA